MATSMPTQREDFCLLGSYASALPAVSIWSLVVKIPPWTHYT